MKKSGSAVFLMELTLVILFFSLSTVVTLRLFVSAHQQERQSTLRSDAMELAENTAELFRVLGVSYFDPIDGWTAVNQPDNSTLYTCTKNGLLAEVQLKTTATDAGSLETGEIRIMEVEKKNSGQEDLLCRLTLGRYSPGEAAA